ncbi:unnamed protein product [Notodromas monacha]|uniref:Topors PWI-like domain-containing protein n=1 Tax=Notodromas monacha TaxID=399045 RepID=A0A7R9BPJ5_9CRUS|nr:unnamed protein product [Notodromas monacha]CAG0918436.1 unnamed protein product [Notodromas monacha]
MYDSDKETDTWSEKDFSDWRNVVKRRYFLLEKAKDARKVGILVGTLSVKQHDEIVERLKLVLKLAGKSFHVFVVGKLNPAKLANFPEVDAFVLVSCPEAVFVEDSKDFLQPIVTPYEMELACFAGGRSLSDGYVVDFRDLLPDGAKYVELPERLEPQADVSLLSNSVRSPMNVSTVTGNTEVALKSEGTLATWSSELSGRTWTGVEFSVSSDNVGVEEGLHGKATGYFSEPVRNKIAGNSSDRRRSVYMRNQWAFPFSFNGRNLNPSFFRENEAQTHRILAWLNRELVAIRSIGIRNLPLRYDPVISVTSEEMDSLGDLLRRFHLLSAEMLSHLARFVGTRLARHFLHELYVFADSRFTLAQYDRQVDYSRTSEAYRLSQVVAIRSIGIRNLPLRYDPVISVTSEEMDSLGDLLRRFHLLSAEMLSHLARFVGTRLARHFLHELYVFADSRFTLAQYDRQVDYSRTSEAYRLSQVHLIGPMIPEQELNRSSRPLFGRIVSVLSALSNIRRVPPVRSTLVIDDDDDDFFILDDDDEEEVQITINFLFAFGVAQVFG